MKFGVVAKEANLLDSQISHFLSGKRGMDYKNISAILNALPEMVYREFCWLLARDSGSVSVEEAIAVLASAPLTDDQLASLLTIASQRLRQPSQTVQRTEQFPVAV